mmetsp:Transcript_26254/g.44294  ORF Transcript_26254/g.44294 Transcript_26254/m.44294 type:complete len:203 (+) Transcript_26254:1338-1946(+)
MGSFESAYIVRAIAAHKRVQSCAIESQDDCLLLRGRDASEDGHVRAQPSECRSGQRGSRVVSLQHLQGRTCHAQAVLHGQRGHISDAEGDVVDLFDFVVAERASKRTPDQLHFALSFTSGILFRFVRLQIGSSSSGRDSMHYQRAGRRVLIVGFGGLEHAESTSHIGSRVYAVASNHYYLVGCRLQLAYHTAGVYFQVAVEY